MYWNVTQKKIKLQLSSPVASQWGTWWLGLLSDDAFEVFLPAFQNWCVTWNLYKAERAMHYSLFYHLFAFNICKLHMYGSIHDMHSLINVIESSHTHTKHQRSKKALLSQSGLITVYKRNPFASTLDQPSQQEIATLAQSSSSLILSDSSSGVACPKGILQEETKSWDIPGNNNHHSLRKCHIACLLEEGQS